MATSSAPSISAETASFPLSRRSNPLASVVSWELRRLGATRSIWIIIFIVFATSCLLEWLTRGAYQSTIPSAFGPRTFWIDWGSNYGLFNTLPQSPGMPLAMYLPFLNVDGIARDLKRRTHELLMTTAIPSGAYIWGRYLSGLLVSLCLACLMLLALVFVALIRHQMEPDLYLVPDLPGMTVLWAFIVLPTTILLSSVGFALGTLWPRRSTVIKVALLVGWFILGEVMGHTATSCQQCVLNKNDRLAVWDPTSLTLQNAQTPASFMQQLTIQTQTQSTQVFLANLHALEQQLPDMSTWIVPRLVWIGVGIAFVLLANLFFRRFRNALG